MVQLSFFCNNFLGRRLTDMVDFLPQAEKVVREMVDTGSKSWLPWAFFETCPEEKEETQHRILAYFWTFKISEVHFLHQIAHSGQLLDVQSVVPQGQGFIQAPFFWGGGDFPPNLATSPPPKNFWPALIS